MGSTIRGSDPGKIKRFLPFSKASRPYLEPSDPPIPGTISSRVFRSRLTIHLSLMPRFKNQWNYTSIPPNDLSA